MSGFYYKMKLVDFDLSPSQLNKVRNYLRDKVRSVAAVDSGEYLRSLKTSYVKETSVLTVFTTLHYAGYVEGGTKYYLHHKDKIRNALATMGLKPTSIAYF